MAFKHKPTVDQVLWQEFNGLADSLWSGIRGTFYKFVGLDRNSNPGSVTVQQALAKDSGTTITDLCKVGLTLSDGSKLFFSYTTGKIWRRDTSGVYLLVYTTVPAAGTAGCFGAYEFNSNIYWATQSRLHYIPIANIATAANWTANAVPNWQVFTATDDSYHPMKVQNAALYVGDAYLVAKVDVSNTFTANSLTIDKPNRIKCMVPLDIDLVVGTIIARTVSRCSIIRWDTIQTTWQYAEEVQENGINSILWTGLMYLVQAGTGGNFYSYNGKSLQPYKRLPGTWDTTHTAEVWTNAIAMWNGIPLFGLSNITGDPADEAVYSIGSYSKDYPKNFSEDFPISVGAFTGVTIGCVIVDGFDLYVAWQDSNNNQGVDKIDYTTKYASAYLETIAVNLDPMNLSVYLKMWANYKSLPTGTALAFKYYANHGSLTTPGKTNDTDTAISQVYCEESIEARVIRMRINFTISSNNAPVVEQVGIFPATHE